MQQMQAAANNVANLERDVENPHALYQYADMQGDSLPMGTNVKFKEAVMSKRKAMVKSAHMWEFNDALRYRLNGLMWYQAARETKHYGKFFPDTKSKVKHPCHTWVLRLINSLSGNALSIMHGVLMDFCVQVEGDVRPQLNAKQPPQEVNAPMKIHSTHKKAKQAADLKMKKAANKLDRAIGMKDKTLLESLRQKSFQCLYEVLDVEVEGDTLLPVVAIWHVYTVNPPQGAEHRLHDIKVAWPDKKVHSEILSVVEKRMQKFVGVFPVALRYTGQSKVQEDLNAKFKWREVVAPEVLTSVVHSHLLEGEASAITQPSRQGLEVSAKMKELLAEYVPIREDYEDEEKFQEELKERLEEEEDGLLGEVNVRRETLNMLQDNWVKAGKGADFFDEQDQSVLNDLNRDMPRMRAHLEKQLRDRFFQEYMRENRKKRQKLSLKEREVGEEDLYQQKLRNVPANIAEYGTHATMGTVSDND